MQLYCLVISAWSFTPSYPSGYLMLPNLTNQFSLSYPMAILSANEIWTFFHKKTQEENIFRIRLQSLTSIYLYYMYCAQYNVPR